MPTCRGGNGQRTTIHIFGDGLWSKGGPPWLSKPPQYKQPQRLERNVDTFLSMKHKLQKVRNLGYVAPGRVNSLTSFFAVPKGESDIRMVYDGTKSRLNDAMWAPWFALPAIEGHLRFVNVGTFLGDIDVSDMFLNFIMHEKLQEHAGIDLTSFFPEELIGDEARVTWERWARCGMGFRDSPYKAVQAMLFAGEIIRGHPKDPSNIHLPSGQPWIQAVAPMGVEGAR